MNERIEFKDAREKVSKLLTKNALSSDDSEKERVRDEIEEILQSVFDNFGEDLHAVTWIVLSAKTDGELTNRAMHVLLNLNREKPFPGL